MSSSRLTPDILAAAHARGLARLRTTEVARIARKSESVIRHWIDGDPVAPATDAAIRAALGAPVSHHPRTP